MLVGRQVDIPRLWALSAIVTGFGTGIGALGRGGRHGAQGAQRAGLEVAAGNQADAVQVRVGRQIKIERPAVDPGCGVIGQNHVARSPALGTPIRPSLPGPFQRGEGSTRSEKVDGIGGQQKVQPVVLDFAPRIELVERPRFRPRLGEFASGPLDHHGLPIAPGLLELVEGRRPGCCPNWHSTAVGPGSGNPIPGPHENTPAETMRTGQPVEFGPRSCYRSGR